MAPLQLYWRAGAAAMAPHAALAELGLDYELIEIDRDAAQNSPAYRALNPFGVVPTLVIGDEVLTEAAAIILTLGDRYPESRLAPADRTQYYRWLVFMTNTVQTAFLRFLYPERHGGEAAGEVAVAELQELFAVLERRLEGREWLAADHRTGADLYLFMLTRWGRRLDPPAWDRPNLRAHFVRTLALPGVARMVAEQGLDLPEWAVTA
jgi:glutathione S-transferase